MKKLNVFVRLFSFAFLSSVGVVQSMELENISIERQRNNYGAISQGKSLQKKYYPELSKLFFGLFLQTLPTELWEKIWEYLEYKNKLKIGLLARSFAHIPQYVQLEKCRQTLVSIHDYDADKLFWQGSRCYLHRFYACAKKVSNIRDITKIDTVKIQCEALLQQSNNAAQKLIAETESCTKRISHFSKTLNYEELKRIKEIYNDLNGVEVYCVECGDEWRNTKQDCYKDCCSSERIKFEQGICCVICCPLACVLGILDVVL